jgi:hypothetical protein
MIVDQAVLLLNLPGLAAKSATPLNLVLGAAVKSAKITTT